MRQFSKFGQRMVRFRKFLHLSDFIAVADEVGPPAARVSIRSPDEEVWVAGRASSEFCGGSTNWPTRPVQREIY